MAAPASGKGGEKTAQARPHRARKVVAIILAVLVVLVAAAYCAAAYYFSSHFMPGTTVNGIDASFMDEGQLKDALDAQLGSFSTTVSNADGSFSLDVPGENVSLASDTAATAHEAGARAFYGWSWPEHLDGSASLDLDQKATFDEDGLKAIVDAAVADFDQDATQPQGSHVAYDQAQGSFVASEASFGTALDADKVCAAAAQGLSSLQPSVTLDDSALLAPAETQTSEQVVAATDAANKLVSGEIALVANGKEVARVTRDQLASWLSVGDDMQVAFDTDAATAWVKDDVAKQAAYSDDSYDYAVNTSALVASLSQAVLAGSAGPLKIPFTRTLKKPAETQGASGEGRHIDVDLSTQYARLYDDSGNVIWESYIVSGNSGEGRDTPQGTFAINNKATNITLIGADENHDGQPDYRSKVSYWMPFLGNSVGLHDASWRSSFGGDIYRYNGSHGCVNLPSSKAAELYSLIKVGDKVVVHG